MSIVNIFFWIMLILLGLLAGLLVDASDRSEKHALAELERIRRTGHLANRTVTTTRPRIGSIRQPENASVYHQSTCFFTVGRVVNDQGDDSREQVMSGEAVTFDFMLPHVAEHDSMDKTNERAVLSDCPSCA